MSLCHNSSPPVRLSHLNRGAKFKILEKDLVDHIYDTDFPEDMKRRVVGEQLWTLETIDGMYSRCFDEVGNLFHWSAFIHVEEVKNGNLT